MDLQNLASGDNQTSQNISPRIGVDDKTEKLNTETVEIVLEADSQTVNNDGQGEVAPQVTEDNEAKIKERIAQCRSIIESLKYELNEEKSKLERDTKMTLMQKGEENGTSPSFTPDSVSSSQCYVEKYENSLDMYSSCVDDKLNFDENLMEYEKQLQKYQNTLNMAQIEKKNAIRKQMLAKAYKLKLLEVENQCNIELLRVKQSLQCLEPLQLIVNKWKTSGEDSTYDSNNFVLIPRYPELSAHSGSCSDLNSVKDEIDSVATEKTEIVYETGC